MTLTEIHKETPLSKYILFIVIFNCYRWPKYIQVSLYTIPCQLEMGVIEK